MPEASAEKFTVSIVASGTTANVKYFPETATKLLPPVPGFTSPAFTVISFRFPLIKSENRLKSYLSFLSQSGPICGAVRIVYDVLPKSKPSKFSPPSIVTASSNRYSFGKNRKCFDSLKVLTSPEAFLNATVPTKLISFSPFLPSSSFASKIVSKIGAE